MQRSKPVRGRGVRPGRPGSVRIIGGTWRGRRLAVAGGPALRPTPDRIRETLFNWLAPALPGARCLDLFAGTGVLGLEALSRGAAEAWLVERDPVAAAALRSSVATLGAPARILATDAWTLLATPPADAAGRFHVVFLDPPYEGTDYAALCRLLDAGWLVDRALVYLEMDRRQAIPGLPGGWEIHREATAGDVRYGLVRSAGAA